jgi:uncharacterized protein
MKRTTILFLFLCGNLYGQNTEIAAFWKEKFLQKNLTYQVPNVQHYSREYPLQTGCGVMNTINAIYCPSDHAIYLSTDLMGMVQNKYNHAVWFMVLAHEYGHATQRNLKQSSVFSIDRELQADCLAGVYFNSQKEYFSEYDIDKINAFYSDNSDNTTGLSILTNQDSHGTSAARINAFQTGYKVGSVNACLKEYNFQKLTTDFIDSIYQIFRKKE